MCLHQSGMCVFETRMTVHQWSVFRMVDVFEFAAFGFFLEEGLKC
jgi:hypothetical protein